MRVKIEANDVQRVFAELDEHEAFAESQELAKGGQLPSQMLQAMTLRPPLLTAMAAMGDAVYPGGVLERTLKEKVILKASELNNCQFCSFSHRAIMKRLGIPKESIENVSARENLTLRERLALVYTVEVMNSSNQVSDRMFEELRGAFSDPEIVELTFLIGYINMLNMFNNSLGIEYRGEYG